jgi:hypothetical protein
LSNSLVASLHTKRPPSNGVSSFTRTLHLIRCTFAVISFPTRRTPSLTRRTPWGDARIGSRYSTTTVAGYASTDSCEHVQSAYSSDTVYAARRDKAHAKSVPNLETGLGVMWGPLDCKC